MQAAQVPRGRGLLWRRPVAAALMIGCVVSAAASGRFCARLIIDGAISFAFIPAFDAAAFAVVRATGARTRGRFAADLDRYFEGCAPWLVWTAVAAAVAAATPPRASDAIIRPAILSALAPLALCARRDFRFYRDATGRDARAAFRDVALHRAISWPAMFTYFLGIAVWHEHLRPMFGGGSG